MSYLEHGDPGLHAQLFAAVRETFGYVPSLFRTQADVRQVVEAELSLFEQLIVREGILSRIQKESILLIVAAAERNRYWLAAQYQTLQLLGVPERQLDAVIVDCRDAGLTPATAGLLAFILKVSRTGSAVNTSDIARLIDAGLTEQAVLEAIVCAALGRFLCSLSTGLATNPDFTGRPIPHPPPVVDEPAGSVSGPFFRVSAYSEDQTSYAGLRIHLGSVPGIFRAQTFRPDLVAAESALTDAIFLAEGLTRKQKLLILLIASAADRNIRGMVVYDAALRAGGMAEQEIDRIVTDHRHTLLADEEMALLDFASKLVEDPALFGSEDVRKLEITGFRKDQIMEAVLVTSLGCLFNTLQFGLGIAPDFEPRPAFRLLLKNKLNLQPPEIRPTAVEQNFGPNLDLDSADVRRVQDGDVNAFEILVDRHGRRVYRTLAGLLGNPDEVRDAMQDTFLKAFQHIGSFQHRAKFSTWLISIATNTGLQRLRERRHLEAIDESATEPAEGFRPRQIQAWTDDPEKLYSRSEMRGLVEQGVMSLPSRYRLVLMLRDIEQLPIEETASALGLGIPAAKSRLLRGRLMLREALSPYFTSAEGGGGIKGVTA